MPKIRRAKRRVVRCENAVEEAQEKWALANRAENDAIRRNASEKVLDRLSVKVTNLKIVLKDKKDLLYDANLILDELKGFEYDIEPELEEE